MTATRILFFTLLLVFSSSFAAAQEDGITVTDIPICEFRLTSLEASNSAMRGSNFLELHRIELGILDGKVVLEDVESVSAPNTISSRNIFSLSQTFRYEAPSENPLIVKWEMSTKDKDGKPLMSKWETPLVKGAIEFFARSVYVAENKSGDRPWALFKVLFKSEIENTEGEVKQNFIIDEETVLVCKAAIVGGKLKATDKCKDISESVFLEINATTLSRGLDIETPYGVCPLARNRK